MENKNPFLRNTLLWHDEEIKRTRDLKNEYSFIWITKPFFYDNVLRRPRAFLAPIAHLYAVMMIMNGTYEFVHVQRAKDYFQEKYQK